MQQCHTRNGFGILAAFRSGARQTIGQQCMHFLGTFNQGDASAERCEQKGVTAQTGRRIDNLRRDAAREAYRFGKRLSASFAGAKPVTDSTANEIDNQLRCI
jgi:hypothetical protein